MKPTKLDAAGNIETFILTLRNQKVIIDTDLARIYGAPTHVFNQAIKRNVARFPADFMFRLTKLEKAEVITNCDHLSGLKFRPSLPFAFTENGAIMAANILNSAEAIRMSVFVVRAFVKMREALNAVPELRRELQKLESQLTARLDSHETAIVEVLQRIMEILNPPPAPPEPEKQQIGFHTLTRPGQPGGAKSKRATAR